VSKILAQLWSVHHSLTVRKEQEPCLRIKTRWGASLLHDLFWMWREEFGVQSGGTSNEAVAASTSSPIMRQKNASKTAHLLFVALLLKRILILRCEGIDVPKDRHGQDDGWSTETIGSHIQERAQYDNLQSTSNDLESLGDLQDPQWMWDMGFPSLVPIDIDFSAEATSTF
jgi:hypothetical protein